MTSSQNISLKGKVAFISGASKGIGVSIAEKFAAAGADLALTARNESELEQTAANARKHGVKVWTQIAELEDADAVKSLADAVLSEFGRVDILVNNAGVARHQPFFEVDIETFHTVINVNLLAPMLLTQAFAPGMVERKSGKIVNISSRGAIRAIPTGATYCASKAALQLMTQTMAVEFGPHNVQANCVAPTVTMTPMGETAWPPSPRRDAKLAKIPTGRFAEPEEVASTVLYLASPHADFINGVELPIDGGEGA
ncbi:MAG: SDR family oxidoreductase, partial [Chloroflexi bacterium]|nr:SDR family oxidoreductase [Chloroflexota bacterium]